MRTSLSKLIESAYVDSIDKSIKGKIAWRTNSYDIKSGDRKYQRKKRLGTEDYDKRIRDFLSSLEK